MADVDHLQRAGVSDMWPNTNEESFVDLAERIKGAQDHITLFGLTRNFYARDQILPLFESKAVTIPVTFYAMDPACDSRRDRSLPTFVTLVVAAFLLMTIDVRLAGGSVSSNIRSTALSFLAPLQSLVRIT